MRGGSFASARGDAKRIAESEMLLMAFARSYAGVADFRVLCYGACIRPLGR